MVYQEQPTAIIGNRIGVISRRDVIDGDPKSDELFNLIGLMDHNTDLVLSHEKLDKIADALIAGKDIELPEFN